MINGTLSDLRRDFQRTAKPSKVKASQWFFKTDPGEYGHGDKFLGITVPEQRTLARKYKNLPLADVLRLLKSPWHEHRLTAVFILADQFRRGDAKTQKQIAAQYLTHRAHVNNWDIVDSSAPQILGTYLLDKSRAVLYRLAKSRSIWDRRIAIISTQAFIRAGEYADTIKLAAILLRDSHDLIHKAVGWMLREVGDRDLRILKRFLNQNAARMPRTMLRYAIEKFPPRIRSQYLAKQ